MIKKYQPSKEISLTVSKHSSAIHRKKKLRTRVFSSQSSIKKLQIKLIIDMQYMDGTI